MKYVLIIVRILMGLLFLFSAVAYFFDLVPVPEMEGDLKTFNEGMDASGYLIPLVKVVELLCAIAFLSGRFMPLATVALFPVSLNIFLVHAILAPEGLPVAAFVLLGNLFLAYASREHYRPMFSSRIKKRRKDYEKQKPILKI